MRTLALLMAACCLSACVTGTDPVPVGEGVYSIGNAASGAEPDGAIHTERYQRAVEFCYEQGKQLFPVDQIDSASPGPAQADAEVRFRCAGPGEPGWKEPAG